MTPKIKNIFLNLYAPEDKPPGFKRVGLTKHFYCYW